MQVQQKAEDSAEPAILLNFLICILTFELRLLSSARQRKMSPLIVNLRPFAKRPRDNAATSPPKRPAPDSETETPAPKKQKRPYHHHHKLEQPLDLQVEGAVIVDDPSVDQLLNFSIGLALREAGFDQADPLALNEFRDCVEAYMRRFIELVRTSMHNGRRTQPLPHDFEFALRTNKLPLDSLRPYLKPSPPTRKTLPALPTPPPEEQASAIDNSFLGDDLSGSLDQKKASHIPSHFPRFPSRHTYQNTEVFTKREADPRKVREQATEEGRLGEEALRKLARAAKDGRMRAKRQMEKRLWGRSEENMETMFEKTFNAIMKKSAPEARNDNADKDVGLSLDLGSQLPSTMSTGPKPLLPSSPAQFEMGPIVNWDKAFWRRDVFADACKTEREAAPSVRASHAVADLG
ncbi:hypothetical protein VTO42DRAFT_146 [Malbranchea cinnamomea]